MYVCYVDDTVIVADAIQRRWKYCQVRNEMIYSKETYESDSMTDEMRTAMTLSLIADTLDPNIQFT